MNIDTNAVAAAVRNVRDGCATENGRDAVDAVSIALSHQFDRQDRDGVFNRSAFLDSCGASPTR